MLSADSVETKKVLYETAGNTTELKMDLRMPEVIILLHNNNMNTHYITPNGFIHPDCIIGFPFTL